MTCTRERKERFIRSLTGQENMRLSDYADHAIDRMGADLIWHERLRITINIENRKLRAA